MADPDLGEATIVYEHPEEGLRELAVPNEHVAYVHDHWFVKIDEDEQGYDRVRRIPASRIVHVDRSTEGFEREVQTLFDRVGSVADRIQTRIPIGGESGATGEPHRIDIETHESEE